MNFRSLSCQSARSGKAGCPRHGVCAWVLGLGAPGSIFYLGLGFAFSRFVIPLALRGAKGTEVHAFCAPLNCHPACPPQEGPECGAFCEPPKLSSRPKRPDCFFRPLFGASGRVAEGSRHHFHLLIVTDTTPLLYPTPRSCYFQYSSPGVAELADAADSKSAGDHSPCGFDSLLRDHLFPPFYSHAWTTRSVYLRRVSTGGKFRPPETQKRRHLVYREGTSTLPGGSADYFFLVISLSMTEASCSASRPVLATACNCA